MSKSWSGGSTSKWRRLRAAILAENQRTAGGRCQAAIPQVCTGQADQVHHTRGRALTGDDPRYLLPVCKACNLHIGEPERHSPEPKQVTKW